MNWVDGAFEDAALKHDSDSDEIGSSDTGDEEASYIAIQES